VTPGYDLPPELTVEADGPVRVVTINRPDRLNAVNAGLHWSFANVWRQLCADREAKVVILTGAGRTFCAGGDFDYLERLRTDPVEQDASFEEVGQILREMLRFPLPVIAAVNGPAIGLGCSLAIMADIVLIADTAQLADPHVAIGLVAGDGGAAMWPLLTNLLRTREYLYTGDRIGPELAVELGLATRVVPAGELQAEARRLADRLAALPAGALRATKRVINAHLSLAAAGPIQAGVAAEAVTMNSPEWAEKLNALSQGRG
jgi:enoyl-CoA hydratase